MRSVHQKEQVLIRSLEISTLPLSSRKGKEKRLEILLMTDHVYFMKPPHRSSKCGFEGLPGV